MTFIVVSKSPDGTMPESLTARSSGRLREDNPAAGHDRSFNG
jgi:hypothetical protein